MIKNKQNETFIKNPGVLNGLDFKIKDLDNCTVFVFDHMACVSLFLYFTIVIYDKI